MLRHVFFKVSGDTLGFKATEVSLIMFVEAEELRIVVILLLVRWFTHFYDHGKLLIPRNVNENR